MAVHAFDDTEREAAIEGGVTGAMLTGPVKQTVVIGADWSRFEDDSQFSAGRVGPLNIATPIYDRPDHRHLPADHTLIASAAAAPTLRIK